MPRTDERLMLKSLTERRRHRAEQRLEALKRCQLYAKALDQDGNRRRWTPAEVQARFRARKKKAMIDGFVEKRRDMSVNAVLAAREQFSADRAAAGQPITQTLPAASAASAFGMPVPPKPAEALASTFGMVEPIAGRVDLSDITAALTAQLAKLMPPKP